jgi:hypothetical protein
LRQLEAITVDMVKTTTMPDYGFTQYQATINFVGIINFVGYLDIIASGTNGTQQYKFLSWTDFPSCT